MFTSIGIDWKSYDDHTEGDQSRIVCETQTENQKLIDRIISINLNSLEESQKLI